jgi:predicted kinase
MKKIVLLVGLPGCGKTTLGKSLESKECIFIDDISIYGLSILKSIINNYDKIVIADVFLCRKEERLKCIQFFSNYNCELEWIFFENDPKKCYKNVDKRADGRAVKGLIKHLSEQYTIPHDSKIIEIIND